MWSIVCGWEWLDFLKNSIENEKKDEGNTDYEYFLEDFSDNVLQVRASLGHVKII